MSSRRYLVLLLFMISSVILAEQQVIYPSFQSENDTRYLDLLALLKASLEATKESHGEFTLKAAETRMTEGRYLEQLKHDTLLLNIAWSSTSEQREQNLLPIRIPLRKGLLGYRISLIRKIDQAKFNNITTMEQLKNLTLGQGRTWGDNIIYEHNGFTVEKSNSYESLFKMLSLGRFDHFPRGIIEVFPEYNMRSKQLPNLHIEENLLIYYPWPYYFFTNKSDIELSRRVETGLKKIIANGLFNKIFFKFHGKIIEKSNLKGRKVFAIKSPILPKSTPLENKELWFDPLTLY